MTPLQMLLAKQNKQAVPAAPAAPEPEPATTAKANPLAALMQRQLAAAPPPKAAEPAPTQPPEPTGLSGLDALEAELGGESASTAAYSSAVEFMPGYIDATAPAREITDDMSDDVRQFLELVDSLYSSVGDRELLGQSCESIMIELQQNPQYRTQLADEDVRMLIQSARTSMGLARVKKQETKTKRSTTSTASKSRKPAAKAVLDSAFGSIDWS